ncbi:hypothetical protein ABFV47_14280 [Mycolicibacterium fortuitum]|uniref:hypothetical protein n=1 Tax=Mycolicibacterium TaxID=1866885 RepID=UPI0032048DF7
MRTRVPEVELDALDAGAQPCIELRPGTLGHQMCWRADGHDGPHISQDRGEWAT